jgi:hypothetical protein
LSLSTNFVADYSGSSNLNPNSALSVNYQRFLSNSSQLNIASSMLASAIEKWEQDADTPETWTDYVKVNETWVNSNAAPNETWTDYVKVNKTWVNSNAAPNEPWIPL